ncbi:hypothetical protein H2200_010351 [Cladophialophora chaetospira]|uniref:Choline monooxygenase, chloroplastic n=1 Tax=Cladophialophora chaetospira TaxID=386627 RepID=A0AA38X1B2_9EURO|nr:hypothetical protein H2200_010351 [Cladophialophora chaetospira]
MLPFLGYLGLGGPSTSNKNDSDTSVRALPASWYTSQEMYELERRAIFSRRWMMITHSLRLKDPGDYLRYDVAGFQFVLSKDREGKIHGFHNVCRHRAFPLVTQEAGQAKIFSCLYHGWSYGLNGKLAKAPGYQDLPDFDKTKNSLFPIHVHIDGNGFLWVNLDAKSEPEIPWEAEFAGMEQLPRYDGIKWGDFVYDHTWEMEGAYNWKIAADNYNECYHCKTVHPDIPNIADLTAYSVDTQAGTILHNPGTKPDQAAAGLTVAPTYYFPNNSMTITPHFFYTQRFVPIGPGKTLMQYEVYRNTTSPLEAFQNIDAIYKRVMKEDKFLCDLTQRNLLSGVFINGEMHPRMEKGPLYFQKRCREVVQEHWKKETAEKSEIWPARQRLPANDGKTMITGKDLEFCSGLACETTSQAQLAW